MVLYHHSFPSNRLNGILYIHIVINYSKESWEFNQILYKQTFSLSLCYFALSQEWKQDRKLTCQKEVAFERGIVLHSCSMTDESWVLFPVVTGFTLGKSLKSSCYSFPSYKIGS